MATRHPKGTKRSRPTGREADGLFEVDGVTFRAVLELSDGLVLACKAADPFPAPAYVLSQPAPSQGELDLPSQASIFLWTDGSCLGNPGPGGWAFIKKDRDGDIERFGGAPQTTNNRMEMQAAIEALRSLPETPQDVLLYSDSQLLVKTMAEGWKRRANLDLWEQLDRLASRHRVTWQWVRGHEGQTENERCNSLAQAAAEAQRIS